jgi:AraC family transcriptional regulator
VERLRFEGGIFTVGSFHAVPGDGLWAQPMRVGEQRSLLVFPKSAVRITQFGVDSVVANTTNVILYDPGREYRRDVVDTAGDHSVFVGLAPARLAQVATRFDPGVGSDDPAAFSFPGMFAPTDPQTMLLERQIERHLASPSVDPLLVEESLCCVVERCLGSGYRLWDRSPAPRPATERTHAELAEAAAEVLSTSFREGRTLSDLAREVLASPFHLARVFRMRTGSSLHAYRNQLRLRSALDRLCEPRLDLTELALESGFSSHSHFTDAFRGAFGAAPSLIRKVARSADISEMRTFLEVRFRPAP